MTNRSIAVLLSAVLLVPAVAFAQGHGKEPGHGKEGKRAADEHKPQADRAKAKHGEPAGHAKPESAAGHGAKDGHKEPTKHGDAADPNDHGPTAKGRDRAGHDQPEPRTRARMLGASEADAHAPHKASAEPARRVRPASRGELEAITHGIKEQIAHLPRVPSRPAGHAVSGSHASARPEVKASLVWRPGLTWPPALAPGDATTADEGEAVRLTWASQNRCTPEFTEPALPSSTWSTVAGLASHRCCGLFQSR